MELNKVGYEPAAELAEEIANSLGAEAKPVIGKKEVEEALGENGRILVRASGTEPLLRVMVEAETQELCKKYVKKVIDAMKAVM